MIEHGDGSVSVYGLRFAPLYVILPTNRGHVAERVPEMFALPGGGRAARRELPDIARRLREAIGAQSWT